LASSDEIARIIDELGWPEPGVHPLQQVSLAYVWIHLAPLLPLAGALMLAGSLTIVLGDLPANARASFGLLFIAGLGLLLFGGTARYLSWRHTGFALNDGQLTLRSGWWHRQRTLLPARRIQSIELKQSFLDRRFGIVHMRLGVAGGSGFSGHVIPALPHEKALALRRDLLSPLP
jgi:putative membrane protein